MPVTEARMRLRDRTWLEKARRLKGRTQDEVAEAAGCSVTFYNRIERGLQMPNVDIALRICQFLEVDAYEFLREKTLAR